MEVTAIENKRTMNELDFIYVQEIILFIHNLDQEKKNGGEVLKLELG